MQAFSIEKALTSGFKLLAREWKSALAWGGLYIASIIVMELLVLGPALGRMLLSAGADPEMASKAMEQALAGGLWPMMLVAYAFLFAVVVVLYSAIARAQLRPEERRWFFLRLSKQELWMGLSGLVLALIMMPAIGIVVVVCAAVIGGVSGGDGGTAVLLGIAIGIPVALACLYVMLRLSLSWLIAWDESRFVLFDSWRLTKGQGWRLVLLYLAMLFMMLIMMVGLFLVIMVIGAVLGLVGKALGSAGIVAVILGGLLLLGGYVVFLASYLVVAMSPWIEAYRGLRDNNAAAESAAS